MQKQEIMNTRCPLCGASAFNPRWKKGKYAIGECGQCHLIYTYPLPAAEELEELYGKKYFEPYIVSADKYRMVFKKRIKWLELHRLNGKLLDIGCETGIFLEQMKNRGWDVGGVEFSKIACDYARKRVGAVVFQGQLEDSHYNDDTFDVVTLWHTLEHLSNPLETLLEVRRILKPDGLLVIETPNIHFIGNYLFRLFGATKHLFFVEHLIHFSTESFKTMVRKAGFAIKEISIGDITITERDYKTLIVGALMYLGKFFYLASGKNLAESIRLVALKNDEKLI